MTNDDALPCKEAVELITEYLEKVMLPQMRSDLRSMSKTVPDAKTILNRYNSLSECRTNSRRREFLLRRNRNCYSYFTTGRRSNGHRNRLVQ